MLLLLDRSRVDNLLLLENVRKPQENRFTALEMLILLIPAMPSLEHYTYIFACWADVAFEDGFTSYPVVIRLHISLYEM